MLISSVLFTNNLQNSDTLWAAESNFIVATNSSIFAATSETLQAEIYVGLRWIYTDSAFD